MYLVRLFLAFVMSFNADLLLIWRCTASYSIPITMDVGKNK